MKKKYFIVIISLILLCILMGIIVGKYTTKTSNDLALYNNLPINNVHSTFMYDTSTPEKAIGASDYVFVAKVNQILRTEYKNPVTIETGLLTSKVISTPYTIYSINVIENIKGELITTDSIEFMQYGGLNEDGESYTFFEGGELLNEGEYYILMVDTWGNDGGIIEIGDPNRIISLGQNYNSNARSVSNIVDEYISAYKNEIIPESKTDGYISKYDVNYPELETEE